ncbi:hypothetical protein PInf_019840 [Phytophthora infestans]|nr:hypothetical protein PInf_019840 [Phytophthora infestans]
MLLPVPSEHKDDGVQSLASDHGDHSPRTSVRSESTDVKAKGTPKAGYDEEEKPRKRLSLADGLARAKTAKAEGAKPSKKRTASKSPLREKKETGDSNRSLFGSSDEENEEEEEEGAILEPWEITNDPDQQQEDFQAAQRTRQDPLVAPVIHVVMPNARQPDPYSGHSEPRVLSTEFIYT